MDKFIVTMQIAKKEYEQINGYYAAYQDLVRSLQSQIKISLGKLPDTAKEPPEPNDGSSAAEQI